MASKRRSPIRGPLLTLALMLGSVAAVVAIADAIDARQKTAEPTVAVAPADASAKQTAVR